jgi:protein-disulfide isomerase
MNSIARRAELACRLAELRRLAERPKNDQRWPVRSAPADDVDPARDHIRGGADAPITLVEYGDYECPYCGLAEGVVRELLASFADDLRYVWRHLPLTDVHPHAQIAAEAAEAAAAQGEFWSMHDELIEHQCDLTARDLTRYAEVLGLDAASFSAELRTGAITCHGSCRRGQRDRQ